MLALRHMKKVVFALSFFMIVESRTRRHYYANSDYSEDELPTKGYGIHKSAHYLAPQKVSEKTLGPFAPDNEFLDPITAYDDQDQGLLNAAMPALVTGLLAFALSSLFTPTMNVNATSASDSFPFMWTMLPIGYNQQHQDSYSSQYYNNNNYNNQYSLNRYRDIRDGQQPEGNGEKVTRKRMLMKKKKSRSNGQLAKKSGHYL